MSTQNIEVSGTDQPDVGGGELLAAEAREEIGRLISRPAARARRGGRRERLHSASARLRSRRLVATILAVVTAVALVVYYVA
jgi:type VI protein secretion system component VasF